MKKLLLSIVVLMATFAVGAYTLKDGYNEIAKLPALKGIELLNEPVTDGWVEALPMQDAQVAVVAHEVGNGQTVYYGSHVEAVANQLPEEQLVISGANFQCLLYVYATPIDTNTSEVLILADEAYRGRTYAVYGKVNQRVVNAMKQGEVRFTPDHMIYLNVPIIGFN